MVHRCAAPLIRHVLAAFRTDKLDAQLAAHRLGLSRARLYKLYADYLDACAHHQESLWTPGLSGGDHAPDWPPPVEALLRKRLSSKPPAWYSFAASEVLRLCGYSLDRAQVRRWASDNHLAHPRPKYRPTRRSNVGSAARSVNSGNWTPRRTSGSPAACSSFR